jgi:hypothetical protein
MKKRSAIAMAAAFACSLAFAAPAVAVHGSVTAPAPAAAGVLYSQDGTDAGIGIVSQLFDSCFDAYDSRAADDFVVSGTWRISEVDVPGVYFNGSGLAESENVTFYEDKKGLPGRVVRDVTFVEGKDNGTGSFEIKVPKTRLKTGRYWVSVQAFMNFEVGGEWGWENQTTVVGRPAAWENPGGGFGTACTMWGPESQCVPEGEADHMFTLKGKAR